MKLLNLEIEPYDEVTLTCVNKTTTESLGRTKLTFPIGTSRFTEKFLVMNLLPYPCIIGLDIMRKRKLVLDPSSNKLYYGSEPKKSISFNGENQDKKPHMLMLAVLSQCETSSEFDLSVERRVKKILLQFPTVARTDGTLGRTDITCHEIKATGPPCRSPPYKKSPMMREIIREQVHQLEKAGMIRPST